MLWKLRQSKPSDESFIFNSWLKSFKDSYMVSGTTTTIYYKEMHGVIKAILEDPTTRVLVACGQDDEDAIYGYAVGQQIGAALIFHWVYVKHSLRNFGIGRNLEAGIKAAIPHESVAYTLRTKLTDILTRKDPYVYNPFILWRR